MVTDEQPLVNLARTGIGSSAIALRIPFRPEGGCGKNISRDLALLFVGACAGVNTTPFSSQESTHRPVISALSKVMTSFVCALARATKTKTSAVAKNTLSNIFNLDIIMVPAQSILALGKIQPTHRASGRRKAAFLQAHSLQYRDEQVWQRII